MKTLSVHEAKTRLSAVLAEIEATGGSFLVCRRGKPVAEIVPHRKPRRLKPHPVMSRIKLKYDPTERLTELEHHALEVFPLDLAICVRATELPAVHEDPCDRLIIATAQLHGLPVVTTDPVFRQYDIQVIS